MNIDKIKEDIVKDFKSKDNKYEYSDRLNVSLHKIVDNIVSEIDYNEVLDELKNYSDEDIKTLDSGLYEGTLEKRGFETFCRVLLYCLIEQELWNDEEFNKLQFIESVNGIGLK